MKPLSSRPAWSSGPPQSIHAEALDNGTSLEVEVRVTPIGVVQMHLVVHYGKSAYPIEEYYAQLPSTSAAEALNLGVDRARALATGVAVAGQTTLEGLSSVNRWS